MRIPTEKFDEIALANDIVDVIAGYIQVKRRGKAYLALCPFHPDKNPSMNISQQKQVYHCFSCGASGNVFTFVMEFEKISFMEAAQKLALRAGIDLDIKSRGPDLSSEISRLYEINKAAAKYYYNNLMSLAGWEKEHVWNYLKKRELTKETIKKFGIGYASKGWDGLLNFFVEELHENERAFTDEDIEKAGLIIGNEERKGKYYDRFRGRLMFPIFNESDKVVGLGGRKLFDDDPGGKYINSPETRIYNKSRILYGLNFAREHIRANDFVLLVEGYMDLISLFQSGIKNVVASSGTSLTVEQVQLISRYTKNIYIVYDADLAGIAAAKRGIELILEGGLDLKVVTLPEGEDPDSIVREKGKEEFEINLHQAKSIISFISSLYNKEDRLNTPEEKTEFVKEIIGYLSKISDKIKRAFYIKEIATLYNLYESDLRDELDKAIKNVRKDSFLKSSVVLPPKKVVYQKRNDTKISSTELELIDVFISNDTEAINYVLDKLNIQYISSPVIQRIIEILLDEYTFEQKIDVYKIIEKFEDADARGILTRLCTPAHEPSVSSKITEHSLLAKTDRKKIDYLKFAQDVLKKLKTNFLEKKIAKLIKAGENPNAVLELKRRSNKISKGEEDDLEDLFD